MGPKHYYELGAGKLNNVNFKGVPAKKMQSASYGFRWLKTARAALEQTQGNGQKADAENNGVQLDLGK